jgi:hypothetical protein
MRADILNYYVQPARTTDPAQHADLFEDLPGSVLELARVVQGCMIHVFWAERYGVRLSQERQDTLNIRSVAGKLDTYRAVCSLPLHVEREPSQKLVGNCRDFSQLMVSMLRLKGIPARARCGFGAYFLPEHFEDHWVAEYWNSEQSRWIMVDAQLDPFQQQQLKIDFDPLDVPGDRFILAGKAWQMCRTGAQDPAKFGIFDMHGMGFIRGNLVRDALALNKVEILPWDGGWGYMIQRDEDMEYDLFDRLALLTQAGDDGWSELRAVYKTDPKLHAPESYGV